MGYAARRFVYLAGPFTFLAGCLSCPALSYCLPACLLASALALHEHFLPFCLIASCLLQMALALTLNGEALKKKVSKPHCRPFLGRRLERHVRDIWQEAINFQTSLPTHSGEGVGETFPRHLTRSQQIPNLTRTHSKTRWTRDILDI